MRSRLIRVGAALGLILVPPATRAGDADTPEAVALRAIKAMDADRFDEFARAFDPKALRQFKDMIVEIAEIGADDTNEGEIANLVDGVKNLKDLRVLDAADVLAGLLRAMEKSNPIVAELRKEWAKSEVRVMGRVEDPKDKDIVYVVTRRVDPDDRAKTGHPEVMGLRKEGRSWNLLFRDELKTWASTMKKASELRREARKKGQDPAEAALALLGKTEIGDLHVDVYGIVPAGKGEADVVYYAWRKLNGEVPGRLSVATIAEGEDGWDLVQKKDRKGLAKLFQEHPPLQLR